MIRALVWRSTGLHNVYVVGETFSNDLGGTINGINALPSGHAVNLSGIIG